MAWLETSGVKDKWTAAAAVNGQVPGAAFVEAAKAIISIFDLITGMGIVKGDMVGNADTLGRHLGESGFTLQGLVEAELKTGDKKKLISNGKTATCACLWLNR